MSKLKQNWMSIAGALPFLLLATLALADTATKTWADGEWSTEWTDVAVSGACDTNLSFGHDPSSGNPNNARNAQCQGKGDVGSRRIEWSGTWEDLGVTAGHVVSTVQMTDADVRAFDTNCDTQTMGPFELRDSGDGLVATLWSGRTATVADGAYVAIGSQSAQSVGALSASSSSIQFWMTASLDIANTSSSSCNYLLDNLDISIEHSAATPGTKNRVIKILGMVQDHEQPPAASRWYRTRVSWDRQPETRRIYKETK